MFNFFFYIIMLFCRKEETRMIELYAALIINGKRTIDSVPVRYQSAVTELLAAVGLDENGDVA